VASSHTEIIGVGKPWPPEEEVSRISRQKLYRQMFNLSEPALLLRTPDWKSKPVETFTSSFVKMVALSYANLIFGEATAITLGADAPEESEAAKRRILRESQFRIVAFNTAIGQSVEGRAYLKVRRGPLHSRDKKERVIIESVNARSVFRFSDPGNAHPTGFMIASEVKPQPNITMLQIEVHYPGEIVHELWRFERGRIVERMNFRAIMGFLPDGLTDDFGGTQQTGIDEILISEINNLDTNGWSMPDLLGSENVIRLLEDRMTRDAEILNKHASPKLAVPPGVLDDKGQLGRATFDGMVFEMGESGLLVPQYITWEPKINESFAYFDKLIGILLANTGLTHQIVGMESKTGFADSGTALRLRMIPTLARVSAKVIHTEPAIEAVMRNALAIADGFGDFGNTKLDDSVDISIQFKDGIPDDPTETARVTQTRTAGGRTMSTRAAIVFHNPEMSDESIDAELALIEGDEAVPVSTRPPVNVDLNAA